jgi:hypothetical protein
MTQTPSKRDTNAAREAIVRELEDWSMYPLLEGMPQYLAPIAKDAGVDLRALTRMNSSLQAMDRKGRAGSVAADVLANRMAVQIKRLIEQVDNASIGQIVSYAGLSSAPRSGDASPRTRPWRALATVEGRQTEKVTYRGREITMARLPEASMWEAAIRTPTPNGRSYVYVYVHDKTGGQTLRAAKAKVDEMVEKLAQVTTGHRFGDARRPDSPAGALYRAFVKEMIAKAGMGFHPDTPVAGYVDRHGKPGFTKAETKRLQGMESKAYAMGDFDQYAIAMQEMRPLIRAAKKRTG